MKTSLAASIDLGTNTCLLLVARRASGSSELEIVDDRSTIVRLGKGVDESGMMRQDAMERTLECLRQYASRVHELGVEPCEVVAVATASARDSKNGPEFFARVESETGFHFRTLTGQEEARDTFLGGLLPGCDPAHSAVIDIGGGSTELMARAGGESLQMGSVRFTERYLKSDPVSDPEFWLCQDAIDALIEPLMPWRERLGAAADLIAVAGTATTLAAWHEGLAAFDRTRIDGCVLTRGDLHRQVEELKWRTIAERRAIPGLEAERADVLLAGTLILWRVLERLNFPQVRVSTRGLRFGVLLNETPFKN